MPSGVNYQQLQDVIVDTLRNLPKDEYELLWLRPKYHGLHIFSEKRRVSEGGKGIQRHVMLGPGGNAQMVPLFNTKQPNVSSNQRLIFVPWTFTTTNYSWDEREIIMNGPDEVGFINLLKFRRDQEMWGFSDLIETQLWSTPQNVSDNLHLLGIPYWLSFLANGSTTEGFNGDIIRYQDGSTGTVKGGLDGSVDTQWNNYAFTYNKFDNTLLRSLRRACRRTHFQGSPLVKEKNQENSFPETVLYGNDTVVTNIEDLCDKRDDSSAPQDAAGKMLHSYDGVAHFNKMPFQYVFDLDNQSVKNGSSAQVNPQAIYAVNWEVVQAFTLKDYWMVEKKPMVQPAQPNLLTVNLDGGLQIMTLNLHTAGFVGHIPL